MKVREPYPFGSEAVKVRCPNSSRAITTKIPKAQIIGHDDDKVRLLGAKEAVLSHLRKNYKGTLFSKSKDWEGEREYRWVFFLKSDAPEFYVSIKNALRAIFLGIDCPHVYDPSIRSVCPAGVSIYRMQWNWGAFLTPMEI